jgi:exodeoxyribonuclease V alpha subunit
METIEGKIQTMSQAFRGGWRILSISPGMTVTGCIPGGINLGDFCSFKGKWQEHPRFGKQFKAEQIEVKTPKDVQGIQEYLMSHFKWIGPQTAKKIVAHFGEGLFEIIKTNPARLSQVPGITLARAAEIASKYLEIESSRQTDIFFSTHGITLNMQAKLVETYGSKDEAFKKVRSDPYALSDEIWGVGFKKADAIALSMGVEKTSPRRIEAGIFYLLRSAESDGHCYLPENQLVRLAVDQLGVNGTHLYPCLAKLYERRDLIKAGPFIYSADMHRKEIEVAEKLSTLAASKKQEILKNLTEVDIEALDVDQCQAVANAINANIQIITGGPGTGKTYSIKQIIQALGPNCKIALAAPTGKAAKRMEEATGLEAKTIHRLLEYNPQWNDFARNEDNPLDCDTLILDEVSMVDVHLMHSLLKAITPEMQLIFVGDKDQLPSVGPGALLRDMIQSQAIPSVFLKTIHRQAQDSGIILNAHRINKGEPLLENGVTEDFYFIEEPDADKIPDIIHDLCVDLFKKWSQADVQVLCPMKKPPIGTKNLNDTVRPVFNQGFDRKEKIRGTMFHVDDKVIQIKNNYRIGIFNGDIGFVARPLTDETFLVDFGGNQVEYPVSMADELQLAYALTIHKGQGSDFPVVIIPVHTANYIMLKRNLLYTAVTRGKKLVFLVGTQKAANIAIRTLDSHKRYTSLCELLGKSGETQK